MSAALFDQLQRDYSMHHRIYLQKLKREKMVKLSLQQTVEAHRVVRH
jgi:hypothetical protein